MRNIRDIIVCPECQCSLNDALLCTKCGTQYSCRHGVYNLLSSRLSGEQEYLYRGEIPEELSSLFNEETEAGYKKAEEHYLSFFNEETIRAFRKQDESMRKVLASLSGRVCDLATGAGTMLQMLLNAENDKITDIVCTDINEFTLMATRFRRNASRSNLFYIATDGRYLAFKDNAFDAVTSYAGFGNIPDAKRVASELYRILKPGGKIVIKGNYIEKDSRSFELAKSVGIERGMVEEYLLEDLHTAGFVDLQSDVVAEAVWAENPCDLVPAAGDRQRFCIIEASKPAESSGACFGLENSKPQNEAVR